MKSLVYLSNDVREAVALACRLYGTKRGDLIVADLLGISERTARAIRYGETNGASVDPDVAFAARMTLRRARAEQLRAELRDLETSHGDVPRAPGGGAQPAEGHLGLCG